MPVLSTISIGGDHSACGDKGEIRNKGGTEQRRDRTKAGQTGCLLVCYECYCKDNVPPIHDVHRLPPGFKGQRPST
jgi:hypothetical protein